MAKRWTNAQVGEIMTKVEVALQTTPEPSAFSKEDHDALVTLVTEMKFVKGAAERWDANHTAVAKLKQRVGLISWVGGLATLGVVGEAIRRAFEFFTK